jgi:pimeloyl-ACP methyl ester carboxylesterase
MSRSTGYDPAKWRPRPAGRRYVGASSGGLIARVFAREYKDEIAGMVLVDSTDPDTVSGRKVNGQDVDVRDRQESKGRTVPPPVQALKDSPPGTLTTEERERIDRYRNNMVTPRTFRPHNLLPAELQKLDMWARFNFNPLVAKTINPFHAEEMQQLYEESQREEPPLGDKPLIVLISGYKSKKGRLIPPADLHPRDQEKWQQKFAQSQWSRNSQYILVDCGHEIHLYRPGWVVEAIRQVVETPRR